MASTPSVPPEGATNEDTEDRVEFWDIDLSTDKRTQYK